ncbi:phosphate signaling complex protein PhoU [Undibacterium sp. Ji67W]|uniref:phosphate signaling complex protein PhoU n=1 Tax=Undibacterium sp. Ji67W TaxID=3413042 RepID=UPI003BF03250
MPEFHSLKQYDVDLDVFHANVLRMGCMVENQLDNAVTCFRNRDLILTESVIGTLQEVNRLEITLDSECRRLIVRHQPTANDLRVVMGTNKVVSDLERIGDEVRKIALSAKDLHLSSEPKSIAHQDMLNQLAGLTITIVHNALDMFARLDATYSDDLISEEGIITMKFRFLSKRLIDEMTDVWRAEPATLNVLWTIKALERITDYAKNIAEQVIFIVDGKDVRHAKIEAA